MLIRDEQTQYRQAQQATREATLERAVEEQKRSIGDHVEGTAWEWTELNSALQRGRGMDWTAFEEKLHELRPEMMIWDHPSAAFRCVYVNDDGALKHVTSYHRGWLPEHSIRAGVEDWEYDMSILGEGNRGLNGRDFDGRSEPPNRKRVLKKWHEAIRGWRTVLLRLMAEDVLTVTEVEAKFGKPSKEDGPGYQNWQYYCHGIGEAAY